MCGLFVAGFVAGEGACFAVGEGDLFADEVLGGRETPFKFFRLTRARPLEPATPALAAAALSSAGVRWVEVEELNAGRWDLVGDGLASSEWLVTGTAETLVYSYDTRPPM
mmetsp:Transcript_52437/g.145794  ORF Transcript_52437/g.145794 Transcript_52437/m.145794 type:complete len:110 (+) Transcript_52437:512-841(+)|eukprot:CAMPEP_0119505166 /NCGR_PEP_ID=MMETSP1344-20130328/25790_1 /TAXON_ID=236787 /ORGANISM="Florenciella parvula, Strain CCMP2471" /LENGTH=109 /DNA_ID=CAMNT_0007541601 /DNA_START=438 /DNA_END=767 /DNA_ORIENTATION=-